MKSSKSTLRPEPSTSLKSKTEVINFSGGTEREPYFFNEELFKAICELHNEALGLFQSIAGSYGTLGIGNITADVMRQIYNWNFSLIEKECLANIEGNLKKLNLTNKVLIDKWREGTEEPFFWFKTKGSITLREIAALRRKYLDIELNTDLYSYQNGVVSFSSEDKIREQCTDYVNTDLKRDFLKLTEDTLLKLQALKAILLKNQINSLFGSGNLFSESDTGEIIISKQILGYIKK